MHTLSGKTKLIAVIADPIDHVMAPELFNPIFLKNNKDIVLVPFHISTANLPQAMKSVVKINNLLGILVTLPHKETVVKTLDDLAFEAKFCDCVNVIKIRDGKSYGQNFDGIGFVSGLKSIYGEDVLTNKNILLIGAGGAAKAISYSLICENINTLQIKNRNTLRAKKIVDKLKSKTDKITLAKEGLDFDILINATSLGLKPSDDLPFDTSKLSSKHLVCDIVMKPKETSLLKAAKEKGANIHYGIEMLSAQTDEILKFLLN